MNNTKKRWMTAASSLVIIGLILCAVALFACGFDLSKLGAVPFESNTYEVSGEFFDISLRGDTENIRFVPSETGKCSVTCTTFKGIKHDVSVTDGKLSITTVDDRAWYEHISISINIKIPKLTVYLPQGVYGELFIDSDTGDISLPDGFTFESITARTDTGDFTISASASGAVELRTDTGYVSVTDACVGSLRSSTSTGDITLRNVTCNGEISLGSNTGDLKLTDVTCGSLLAEGDTSDLIFKNVIAVQTFSAEVDTGDIKLEACDANALYLEADTGDIIGTLLTEKVFLAETDTGDIDVPKSITGGRCEIYTNTGDIEMRIIN